MNQVYRIVWNAATLTWVVAPEFAKGRKKSCKSSRTARLRTVVFALGILGGAAAHAAVIATPAQAQNGTYSGTSTTSASATGGDSTAVGAAATASAQGATAVGAAAKATNQNATAVGILAIASGQQSVALGWQATSSADYAMAFGGNASAAGIQSLALGTQASTTAAAKDAIALGTLSKASAANATALGTGANASGDYSMALGYNTSATGTAGVALGSTAQAVQQGVAVGSGANAAGVSSIALGLAAKAANSNGVAIGTSAQTGTGTSTAIGSSSKADAGTTTGAKSATAVGANAAATGDGALAQGDSATATGDKATAVGRGAQAIGGSTTALGAGATASTQAATALGAGAVASGVSSMAVGVAATAGGVNSLAMGLSAAAGGQSSLAIGNRASGGGQDSIAIGRVSSAGGQNSIAIGGGTPGTGNDSSSSYSGASAAGQDSIAVGRAALAGGQNSIAIGGSGSGQGATPGLASWASGEDGIALGRGAQSSDTRNIALGALSHAGFADGAANAPFSTVGNTINGKYYAYAGGTADSTVSVGNSVTKLYRTVTNVAAGRVSSSSTDAVNGSQLYAAYQAFGASVGDGTGSSDLADVVKYDDATHNSVTLGNTVSTDGGVTGGTRITNVAQGALSATSTDAVNGAQLYATNQNVADVSNTVNNINNGAGIKYFHANSTKDDSSATGNDAIAVGPKAIAAGNSAIAMGNGAQATSGSGKAIAIGDSAVANGGISIGETSKTADSQQIAIGPGATVKAGAGIALGALSSSTGTTDVAIGYLSQANGGQSIAMGTWASTASGANYAMAMGYQASASAERSVALGLTAKTTAAAQYGVAIGNASSASALGGVAVGSGAAASQDNGVAIGRQSTTLADLTQSAYNPNASATIAGATPFGEFSVGAAGKERRITNVAAGAAATDAVNVSQLQAAVGLSSADAVKYDDATHNSVTLSGTLSTDGGVTGGTKISNVAQAQLSATSTDAVNGAQLYATNQQVAENTTNITNLGNKVTTLADTPITFAGNSGSVARKLGETMSIQGEASTSGSYSGANLKTQVDSNGDLQLQMADNLALTSVTTGNTVINNNGLTINGGPSVTVDGINAGGQKISNVADGTADSDAATVGQVNAVASTITADAVKYDDASHNSVTLGNTVSTDGGVTGGTKISNVAQGELSATSTDAVNGSQLYATNQQVGENTTNITNLGDTVNNLGDSITNIAGDTSNTYVTNNGRGVKYARTNDTGLTSGDAHATVAGATALGYEATASHGNSVALGANALADGSTLNDEAYLVGGKAGGEVSVGAAGNTRRITNLAAGANDTDAVNVSQLKASVAGSVADAVMYDDASHNSITLGGTAYDSATGTGGTRISNVAKGTADSDAVNVAQLKDSGLIDSNGNAQKAVLFNGPNGEANVAGTKIVNVAAGDVTSTSTDAVNGSQLYATNQQVGENTTNISQPGQHGQQPGRQRHDAGRHPDHLRGQQRQRGQEAGRDDVDPGRGQHVGQLLRCQPEDGRGQQRQPAAADGRQPGGHLGDRWQHRDQQQRADHQRRPERDGRWHRCRWPEDRQRG
ncbi:Predicted membrane protein [Variovorax sp. HW608]|uniref:ESPR-type extended signal peptide-containing protein n=1 Tax=Variovorax sp. HW608 TaxID=1034889 RepID=UPI00081FFEA3|nr:ESPR-type extended signal peptide-containing protein [Variovorax sp. HW608]SCK39941.1 Predicted membrane protein [Variovorax sp. HW608]